MRIKRSFVVAMIVITVMGVVAMTAQACSYRSAQGVAMITQSRHCGDFWHQCVEAVDGWPRGYLVNRAHDQWDFYGYESRRYVLGGNERWLGVTHVSAYCHSTYFSQRKV